MASRGPNQLATVSLASSLTVADDGSGDPVAIARRLVRATAPAGLANIRGRARELHGVVLVLPRCGGVRPRAEVPVAG